MKNTFTFLLSIMFSQFAFSTIWLVGPTQSYTSPNALYLADQSSTINIQNNDTIRIDSAIYSGNNTLAAWQQDNLLIQGVNGQPQLYAAGSYILGKGIWVCSGNDITVDNIAFYDAAVPDENGAGIRLDGIGLTVRNCYFKNNENGILTGNPNAGDILIEYSEFNSNGFGDGYTHNMYIGHVNNFTIRYCYTHHARVGHNIKSRAQNNTILYNRIMDEDTGNSSRLIDLPNGGYALIMGNIMMQGPNAINNNCIGYGLEGLSNTAPHEFYCINNTIVNKRAASCNYIQIQSGATVANISNNIFAGTGNELVGTSTVFTNNYYTQTISDMFFIDEANYDYQLLVNSPAIDSGLFQTSSLIANKEYVLDLNFQNRPSYGSGIDIGAYEFFIDDLGINNEQTSSFLVYPNPANNNFTIKFDKNWIGNQLKLQVLDINQRIVQKDSFILNEPSYQINIPDLSKGMYYVVVTGDNMRYVTPIVVQ